MRANVFQRWSGTAACSVKHGIQKIQERLDEELGTVLMYSISEAEDELEKNNKKHMHLLTT